MFDAVPLVEGVPFRATAKCPAFEVPASVARAVEKKQLKDEAEVTRIAEAEARSKRREEAIASFFGADTDKDDAAAAGDRAADDAAPAQVRPYPNGAPPACRPRPAAKVKSQALQVSVQVVLCVVYAWHAQRCSIVEP